MKSRSLIQPPREYERALTAIFGLLLQSGVRRAAISTMIDRSLEAATAKARDFRQYTGGELATLGLVLDAWHRDRRYLTKKGKPRAVPLLGKPPSIQALIRSQGRELDAADLACRMKSLQLIERCSRNRFQPASETALVSTFGPAVLQYVARCLASLLETVEHNLSCGTTIAPLVERTAEVPTLPVAELESFRRFSKAQGSVFIRTINDWLETRRVRTPTDATDGVRAGVHLYAYMAPTQVVGSAKDHDR